MYISGPCCRMGLCYGDMRMAMMFTNTLGYDMQGRKRKARKPRGEIFKKYKAPSFQPLQSSSGPVRRDEGIVYKSVDDHGPIAPMRDQKLRNTQAHWSKALQRCISPMLSL